MFPFISKIKVNSIWYLSTTITWLRSTYTNQSWEYIFSSTTTKAEIIVTLTNIQLTYITKTFRRTNYLLNLQRDLFSINVWAWSKFNFLNLCQHFVVVVLSCSLIHGCHIEDFMTGFSCWLGLFAMEETKIIYHIDDEETPYLVKLTIAPERVTLADFKNVLNRPNYKFFFKSMDDDFG